MSYQCPTCGKWGSCWSPSFIGLPENPAANEAARLRAALETVKEKLRIDDPHDLYDIVCDALSPNYANKPMPGGTRDEASQRRAAIAESGGNPPERTNPPDPAMPLIADDDGPWASLEHDRCTDPNDVFRPCWPPGLRIGDTHRVHCDDKGRRGGSWMQVYIANDGDVHVSMQDWEDVPHGEPTPFPSIRIRTGIGGGRNARTRQALLWLAEAMRLDAEERQRHVSAGGAQ